MKLKTVHTCNYRNVVTRIKQTDQVRVLVGDMPAIPAGANPFHHDSFSMGTDLARGWMVMHAGFDSNNGFEDMYLVNTTTGQRIQLTFQAENPEYENAVYVGDNNALHQGELYTWDRTNDEVKWLSLHDGAQVIRQRVGINSAKVPPVYVYFDKWFVLYSVLHGAEARATFIADYEPSAEAIAALDNYMDRSSYHYDAFVLMVSELEKGVSLSEHQW